MSIHQPIPLRLSPAQAEEARQIAWDNFMRDYLGAVDDDPGTARVRWWAETAAIDAVTEGEGDHG